MFLLGVVDKGERALWTDSLSAAATSVVVFHFPLKLYRCRMNRNDPNGKLPVWKVWPRWEIHMSHLVPSETRRRHVITLITFLGFCCLLLLGALHVLRASTSTNIDRQLFSVNFLPSHSCSFCPFRKKISNRHSRSSQPATLIFR